jgi:L-ascorbate metabolism protein UlaG (beta-lactamase superfamily)
MKITWLGHAGFRIEIGDQCLLIDPWFSGNPVFPEGRRTEAIAGATHILITHGHGDHASDAAAIAAETGAPVVCGFELAEIWGADGVDCKGMGKGGTQMLGDVAVTMVNATHSSTIDFQGRPVAAGSEAGFMIGGEGHVIYVSGDTDIMADMDWMGDLHKPDIGILACGGHYTMDIARAAYAARRYFKFRTVIPCHFRTFGLLAQSAQPLAEALPGVDVRLPEVMETITI